MEKISKDEEIIICKKALNNWGYAIQKVVAMEECSELIDAITNSTIREPHNVEEEIADIEIMCIQLRIIYGNKEVDKYVTNMTSSPIKTILQLESIKACTDLIKAISKSIRSKESKIHKKIAWMEIMCGHLRDSYNNEKVDDLKQFKLKRLKELIY